MIRLFIENTELELGEDFSCPITRTFEDIENPTNIKNDFSKTVTIAHTQKNDQLFGHIYNPDRLTVANQKNEALKGIYFDPYKKIDFRLEWNDSVVMTGYLKVLSVTDKGYECTLNGELGKIFQEMQKITFVPGDDTTYFFDTKDYYNEILNTDLIYDSFNSTPEHLTELKKIGDDGYDRNQYLQFFINQYWMKEMDSKTLYYNGNIHPISDYLKVLNPDFETKTQFTFDAVTETVTPITFSRLLAQSQFASIPIKVLFLLYQQAVKEKLGVDIDLSDDIFNSETSPLVNGNMMLGTVINNGNYSYEYTKVDFKQGEDINITLYQSSADISKKNTFLNIVTDFSNLPANPIQFYLYFDIPKGYNVTDASKITINNLNNVETEMYVLLRNKNTGNELITHNSKLWEVDTNPAVLQATIINNQIRFNCNTIVDYSEQFNDIVTQWPNYEQLGYAVIISYNGAPLSTITYNGVELPWQTGSFVSNLSKISQTNLLCYSPTVRLYSFWDGNYTPWQVIMNLCKMFRILIQFDNKTNKLKFISATNYFKDYKVLDYENKIDKTKDYTIKPITFEDHFVEFNIDNDKDTLHKNFTESTGLRYGCKKLITNYNFSDSTKEFKFAPIKSALVYQFTYLDLKKFIEDNNVSYISYDGQASVSSSDNGNAINSFGTIGNIIHNTQNFKNYTITQCPDGWQLDKAVLSLEGKGTNIVNLMGADDQIIKFNYTFSIPNKLYYQTYNYYQDVPNIYSYYWSNYINERYNTQNKLVTCYLRLTPTDFINFEFNHFIQIDNQLYMVNKIYDYDITNDEPTKVDLITIQDIKGYTTNNLQ